MGGTTAPLHGGMNMVLSGVPGIPARDSMEQLWLQQQQRAQAMAMGGAAGMQASLMQNLNVMQQGMQLGMTPALLSQVQGNFRQGMQMRDRGQPNALQNLALGADATRMGLRAGLGNSMASSMERGRDRGERSRGLHGGMIVEPKRSMLLEEFRTSKVRKFELRDIIDHCDEFCRDQHGSRFIQVSAVYLAVYLASL